MKGYQSETPIYDEMMRERMPLTIVLGDMLPDDPDVKELLRKSRVGVAGVYSELIRSSDQIVHHLADMGTSAFYENMRVPSLVKGPEPIPQQEMPAWLRRPVNGNLREHLAF